MLSPVAGLSDMVMIDLIMYYLYWYCVEKIQDGDADKENTTLRRSYIPRYFDLYDCVTHAYAILPKEL